MVLKNIPVKVNFLIFAELIIWSFFSILTTLSNSGLDPIVNLFWTSLVATLFFGALLLLKKKHSELKNPLLWKYGFLVALFIGVLFYGLFFIALEYTLPGKASIIALFEIFTSYILFNLFRKEKFSLEYKIGAFLMVLGAFLVLVPKWGGTIGLGEILILVASVSAPFGNLYQQKARKIASSESIVFVRTLLVLPILFLFISILGKSFITIGFYKALPFIFLNGVLVFGISKILWVEIIHRATVTKVLALNSFSVFITIILSFLLFKEKLTTIQMLSTIPFIVGIFLLTNVLRLKRVSETHDPFHSKLQVPMQQEAQE